MRVSLCPLLAVAGLNSVLVGATVHAAVVDSKPAALNSTATNSTSPIGGKSSSNSTVNPAEDVIIHSSTALEFFTGYALSYKAWSKVIPAVSDKTAAGLAKQLFEPLFIMAEEALQQEVRLNKTMSEKQAKIETQEKEDKKHIDMSIKEGLSANEGNSLRDEKDKKDEKNEKNENGKKDKKKSKLQKKEDKETVKLVVKRKMLLIKTLELFEEIQPVDKKLFATKCQKTFEFMYKPVKQVSDAELAKYKKSEKKRIQKEEKEQLKKQQRLCDSLFEALKKRNKFLQEMTKNSSRKVQGEWAIQIQRHFAQSLRQLVLVTPHIHIQHFFPTQSKLKQLLKEHIATLLSLKDNVNQRGDLPRLVIERKKSMVALLRLKDEDEEKELRSERIRMKIEETKEKLRRKKEGKEFVAKPSTITVTQSSSTKSSTSTTKSSSTTTSSSKTTSTTSSSTSTATSPTTSVSKTTTTTASPTTTSTEPSSKSTTKDDKKTTSTTSTTSTSSTTTLSTSTSPTTTLSVSTSPITTLSGSSTTSTTSSTTTSSKSSTTTSSTTSTTTSTTTSSKTSSTTTSSSSTGTKTSSTTAKSSSASVTTKPASTSTRSSTVPTTSTVSTTQVTPTFTPVPSLMGLPFIPLNATDAASDHLINEFVDDSFYIPLTADQMARMRKLDGSGPMVTAPLFASLGIAALVGLVLM